MPYFFSSVSSIKANLPILEYLRILTVFPECHFLISAYDIYKASREDQIAIISLLNKTTEKGGTVLLDSGNYESYWWRDKEWNVEKFHSILQSTPCQISFAFDYQEPIADHRKTIDVIEEGVLRNQAKASGSIIPIIHALPEQLPEIAYEIAKRLNPLALAIPERRLGDGVIQRAKNVQNIRESLNRTGYYYPLHLLGTGNPRSILLYSLSGADSFDGLEWCQTVVDHRSGLLYHFQQREILQGQPELSLINGLPYAQATLIHNLVFYKQWMAELRDKFYSGHSSEFSSHFFSTDFLEKVFRDNE